MPSEFDPEPPATAKDITGAEAVASAVRTQLDAGDAQGALGELGRFLAQAVAERVALDTDRQLTPAYLFASSHLRTGALDGLWHWLWDLLQSRPALARVVVPDLTPVVLDSATPLHLRLKAYVAGGFWHRPDRFAELCQAIREEPSFPLAHAVFQQLMMRAGQNLIGANAALWPEVRRTYDALVERAPTAAAPGANAGRAERLSRIQTRGLRRVAIVTDRMSDMDWHGPTRAIANYVNLLTAAGARVTVFETNERTPTVDERRFVEAPLDWPPFRQGKVKPFPAEIRAPRDRTKREVLLAGTVASLASFDPDIILRMGAERCLPAAASLWPVPVIAIALNAVYPANLDCDAVFMKGARPALRRLFDAAGPHNLPRLVEHRYFVGRARDLTTAPPPPPEPELHPDPRPIRERLGIAPGERVVFTVGHDLPAYCDEGFIEAMRQVLDGAPGSVWMLAGRALPASIAALHDEGYDIRHVPELEPFDAGIWEAWALAVPFRQIGGAGAQYRAARAGCPVFILENALSDGYRLFWQNSAMPTKAAFIEHLTDVLRDPAQREAASARQRASLLTTYPAPIDDPEAIRPLGEVFLDELMAEWERFAGEE